MTDLLDTPVTGNGEGPLLVVKMRQLRTERDAAVQALDEFKTLVRTVATQRAIEHEWCHVIDDVLVELGLPAREKTWHVETKVSYTAWVKVTATSEEEAKERLREGGTVHYLPISNPFVDRELVDESTLQWNFDLARAELADDDD